MPCFRCGQEAMAEVAPSLDAVPCRHASARIRLQSRKEYANRSRTSAKRQDDESFFFLLEMGALDAILTAVGGRRSERGCA